MIIKHNNYASLQAPVTTLDLAFVLMLNRRINLYETVSYRNIDRRKVLVPRNLVDPSRKP